MKTLNIQEMQKRVSGIVAKAENIREAIAQAQADETISVLCREIVADAVYLAWSNRRDADLADWLAACRRDYQRPT